MSALIEWLTKILDEDATMAQAAIDDDGGRDGGFEDALDLAAKGRLTGPLAFFSEPCVRMIAWNTPRRVLSDIAAKRAIIALHEGGVSYPEDCGICNESLPCQTVALLGSAYSTRPGYDESWRP